MALNIYPDLCMFGKALGNGHPITAILGRKKIMKNAEDTFISSTFWTDRVGPAAAGRAAAQGLGVVGECVVCAQQRGEGAPCAKSRSWWFRPPPRPGG